MSFSDLYYFDLKKGLESKKLYEMRLHTEWYIISLSNEIIGFEALLHILRYESSQLLVFALCHNSDCFSLKISLELHAGDFGSFTVEVHLYDVVLHASSHHVDAPHFEQLLEIGLGDVLSILEHAGYAGAFR